MCLTLPRSGFDQWSFHSLFLFGYFKDFNRTHVFKTHYLSIHNACWDILQYTPPMGSFKSECALYVNSLFHDRTNRIYNPTQPCPSKSILCSGSCIVCKVWLIKPTLPVKRQPLTILHFQFRSTCFVYNLGDTTVFMVGMNLHMEGRETPSISCLAGPESPWNVFYLAPLSLPLNCSYAMATARAQFKKNNFHSKVLRGLVFLSACVKPNTAPE